MSYVNQATYTVVTISGKQNINLIKGKCTMQKLLILTLLIAISGCSSLTKQFNALTVDESTKGDVELMHGQPQYSAEAKDGRSALGYYRVKAIGTCQFTNYYFINDLLIHKENKHRAGIFSCDLSNPGFDMTIFSNKKNNES